MKKIYLLLLTSLFYFAGTSCNPDDHDAKPSNPLIGHWNGSKQFDAEYKNNVLTDSETTYVVPPDFYKLVFNEDGSMTTNYSIAGEKEQEKGSYTIKGDSVILNGTGAEPEYDTYAFKVSGNTLVLNQADYETSGNDAYKDEEYIYFTKQ